MLGWDGVLVRPWKAVRIAAFYLSSCLTSGGSVAIPVQGGEIDASLYDEAEVYVDTPTQAAAPAACGAAKSYVERIQNARYDTVADLFSGDAVLFEPSRVAPRVGRARIDQFYRSTIARVKPKMIAVAYVGAGLDCAVELAVERRVRGQLRYVLASVDHFTVGEDGRVVRLLVFTRPSGPRVVTPKLD